MNGMQSEQLLLVLPVLLVTACGGGGGGGSGSVTVPASTEFTSWSAVPPSSTATVHGSSQEAAYTWDAGTNTITSIGALSPFGRTATADISFDASRNLAGIRVTSADGTSFAMSKANLDTVGYLPAYPGIGAMISKDGQTSLLIADPIVVGWDYQTFGVWTTGAGTGNGKVGAFSIGALTPSASIPTSGTATYGGGAGGRYVDSAGAAYFTLADMTAGVDFAARTIAFSTTGTRVSVGLVTFSANPNLNISGTMTYAPGENRFSGPITTAGGAAGNAPMNGSATGSFYGPAAQEIGGGFSASGGGAIIAGSFGGKK